MSIERKKIVEILAAGPADGMQAADLTQLLGLSRDHRVQVRRVLKALCRRGLLMQHGRRFVAEADALERLGEADRAREADLLEGRFKVTPAGHAYVDLEDAAYAGILVEAADFGAAIDGDLVAVSVSGGRPRGRRRGRVAAVRERGRRRVVGTLQGPPWRLVVDDVRLPMAVHLTDAPIPADLLSQLGDGARLVVCEIRRYPEAPGDPVMVEPTVILGPPGELATEVERILWDLGVPQEWPADVLREAEAMPAAVRESDLVARADRRDLPFVTIDPETAKDFDDAVCARRGEEGTIEVWVAIADVSHYVVEDSAIDVEARIRGCSVYLPGRAIPMLPDALSAHLCSLVPEEDRLAMVVRFVVTAEGEVRAEEAESALIRSRARLDYPGVAAALAGDFRGLRSRYQPHAEDLALLAEAADHLRQRRERRGSLTALDLPEAKVVLDEDDPTRVRDIVAARSEAGERGAYNLIEELMIAANEAVARIFLEAEASTVFRVHAEPRHEALERLVTQLGAYGMYVELPQIEVPKGMNQLLAAISGHSAARPLAYLALRALAQAEYHVENRGHFGLASEAYLHFTSPIRRYPDLLVHRLLKALLRRQGKVSVAGGALTAEGSTRLRQTNESQLRALAREASETERRAMNVERRMVALYAATLLRDRVGDSFDGMVINFSSFGVFVGLDEPHVEGMIRVDSLPGQVDFDADLLRFEGCYGAPSLRLGDRLKVRVVGANMAKRQIDLELVSGGNVGMGRTRRYEGSAGRGGGRSASNEEKDPRTGGARPSRARRGGPVSAQGRRGEGKTTGKGKRGGRGRR
ncbi:MAG: VacB/RNase II family 3'-5' exoribonuclease [Deltaproteobacteria bacterium]|nr:VacB/RNase II family 3'-5' exoribonuclease [Deltaproteobacteria bacterium]